MTRRYLSLDQNQPSHCCYFLLWADLLVCGCAAELTESIDSREIYSAIYRADSRDRSDALSIYSKRRSTLIQLCIYL